MLFHAATLFALSLAACDGGAATTAASAVQAPAAGAWTIGPIIRGRNYSHGMPLHPTALRGGGFAIDLPQAPGSVHYVTFRHGSLAGKRRIVMRYRIEAAPGVRIVPRTNPAQASMITPFFQRSGDNWSARGRYEAYRWYGTFATHSPLQPGTFEMVAPLDGNWTAVERSSARTNPAGFRDAVANADQVGFVLGGGDGYGHGVYATGRARLIVTDFRVE
ncbi:hypothetical protein [Sphingosinicella sp. YJ22]|uniref:hypothetical protein n=1 Tax=Sphingosinicella sp. YJ22 TaxID=1104780 RepID=UPI00140D294E|nr:hypothetical protein [Sphingosinicella sp. YJ22]